ncbi:MAG: hypothetical protein AB1610_01095 [Nitrospirota bacterium]
MRILFIITALVFLLVPVSNSEAVLDLGISIGEEGLRSFHLAIGDFYKIPRKDIGIFRKKLPDEEIPVALFLAQRARIKPAKIIDLRLRGKTWMDISLHFGLGPEIFHVPVKESVVLGPPYGKAYGYYKNKPKKEWKKIRLRDGDIINLVNLKFLSEHYGLPPEKVIKMREKGIKFISINDEIVKEKKGGKGSKEHKKEKDGEGKKEKHKGKGWKD